MSAPDRASAETVDGSPATPTAAPASPPFRRLRPAGEPAAARRASRERTARWLGLAAPSLVFLGVRLVGLLGLAWLSEANNQLLLNRLSVWDGKWMLALAGGGYDDVPLGLVDAFGRRGPDTALAFFPGYPFTVGTLRFVTGMDLEVSALVVSGLAGLVLAHGLARLAAELPGGSRWAGLLLVALVAAAPMGVVWSMTYSEGLFCACAVWALVAARREHWVVAGTCTALAGLVRPTGGAVLAAVGVGWLLALSGPARPGGARGCWRSWAGMLLAPLGLSGYLGYVAARTGSPMGWFLVQRRGWNSRFDAGAATLRFTRDTLASGRSVLEVVTVAVLAGALVLLGLSLRDSLAGRLPWPMTVYAVGVLAMDLCSNGLMNSKARLALPAFTLLVPVALGLSRRRPGTAVSVVVAATVASAWFGGYALTGWSYAI